MRNDDTRGTTLAELTGRADGLIDTAFAALSHLRGARIFHPHGITLRGQLTVSDGEGLEGTDLFRPERDAQVLVRLSKGVGLPDPLPDILGVAVRVVDAYGTGDHQDLLLATTMPTVVGRFVLSPRGHFDNGAYSSLLPYRIGRQAHLFGASVENGSSTPMRTLDDVASVATTGGLTVVLGAARVLRPWRPIASISATSVVPSEEGEALRFDPWRTGGGIEPHGLLQRVRRRAYPGSQRGRPDTSDPVDLEVAPRGRRRTSPGS
jgi:hypothetical protein